MMEVTPVGMLGVNCSHHMATMWLLTLITVVTSGYSNGGGGDARARDSEAHMPIPGPGRWAHSLRPLGGSEPTVSEAGRQRSTP